MTKKFRATHPIAILATNDKLKGLGFVRGWVYKPVKQVEGVYKGRVEDSFLIILDNPEEIHNDMARVMLLAEGCGQETVLYSDDKRNTWLIDVNTKERTPMGKLTEVTKEQALAQDSYTYIPYTKNYWAIL